MVTPRHRPHHVTSCCGAPSDGLGLGLLWGVAARVWMRLINPTNPEFSWAGTLMILTLAALLGLGVGLLAAAKVKGARRWWRLAVVPGLLIFASQGLRSCPPSHSVAWSSRGGTGRCGRSGRLRPSRWSWCWGAPRRRRRADHDHHADVRPGQRRGRVRHAVGGNGGRRVGALPALGAETRSATMAPIGSADVAAGEGRVGDVGLAGVSRSRKSSRGSRHERPVRPDAGRVRTGRPASARGSTCSARQAARFHGSSAARPRRCAGCPWPRASRERGEVGDVPQRDLRLAVALAGEAEHRVGATVIRPSMVGLRCTPRNGRSGSGTG